jgi:triosephosphate isomerase
MGECLMSRIMLIAGNWKMNGLRAQLDFFADLGGQLGPDAAEVLICPPTSLLGLAAIACEGGLIKVGGQDCHASQSGAHTGDVSAQMLADSGARYVIVGHSERRADHGETSEDVRAKAIAALQAELTPIICVGETLDQRKAGNATAFVGEQLLRSIPDASMWRDPSPVVIAYEPVWAIGTGMTASLDDIAEMHAHIRGLLPQAATTRILYGGSVKPDNAADILALDDVDGALVGGASLAVSSIKKILDAANTQAK